MGANRKMSIGSTSKDQTRLRIEQMEAEREERRRLMQERKEERAKEEKRNLAAGNPGDVDFIGLVRQWRKEHTGDSKPHSSETEQPKICICVRKRPVSDKERKRKDHDSVTCLQPSVWVHSAKLRVDGITKYLDHSSFTFDHAFDEKSSTEEVYKFSTMSLVNYICRGEGCRATVFAYGQTGSGKTHTMGGIESMVAEDIFLLLSQENGGTVNENGCSIYDTEVTVSFFEIYGGRVQDLLNDRRRLKVLEDGKGEVVVSGLEEFEANNPMELLQLIETANKKRTTHATEANDTSSRSHAICQINLRDKESSKLRGKLSLVDLAGSERGSDTKSHNRQRRTESSEINTSLLALKECIRALGAGKGSKHVPYRASKLTLILKDCFTSNSARTSMIATVSPGALSADHTLNTLRYADRIKEKKLDNNYTEPKDDSRSLRKSQKSTKSLHSKDSKISPPRNTRPKNQNISKSPAKTSEDDLDVLHESLKHDTSDYEDELHSEELTQFHRTVQTLFAQEEDLLNTHMNVIQENAELLTEEGKLLQGVQGDGVLDYDIDHYASRLGEILDKKTDLIGHLREKLENFRAQLAKEEELSRKVTQDSFK
mmetsp:Transcript_11773/g.16717  ORF Transcript_11773/g.16717 Transcript_11773/m.16717 type:complete len:600 (+) Transcript_11773:224-2023(+)|eukprot:CAMPEP_0184866342 /NCGR_PEP_ID=MMETSP0580-20130426/21972_1 /TAXON_ID=1118495 /ORGANISM="Dactyliosolen fragilissimus" /LENGTH=599 /DNA_ID=CAMNT_0027365979 /DNA_START=162 /DNA_END=1961 /DNA_ORIENTATION=+